EPTERRRAPSSNAGTTCRLSFNECEAGTCSSTSSTKTNMTARRYRWHGATGLAGAPHRRLRHCRATRVGASRSAAEDGDEESGPSDLAVFVGLDEVALLEVLEVGQADATLEALPHLADVVLEALERRDAA